MQTRILLVDHHRLFREGLRRLLDDVQGLHVVGEADGASEMLELARESEADLVLLDISNGPGDGVDAIRRLGESGSKTRVLVVSECEIPNRVEAAFRAGASGYLSKTAGARDLVAAIEAVRLGGSYLSPTVARKMARAVKRSTDRATPLDHLSGREREVLVWLAEGLSSREIGEKLSVSPRTVDSHRVRLMKKLGIHKVQALVRLAIREGLIEA